MTTATAQLNSWITPNLSRLRTKITHNQDLDEDAFQDAYLSLAAESEKQANSGEFESLFMAAYRKICRTKIRETFTISHPDELFFTLLPADDSESGEEALTEKLAAKIQRYIRATFSRTEVRILELRMLGFSCRDIAETFGIGTTAVNGTTDRILRSLRLKFANTTL